MFKPVPDYGATTDSHSPSNLDLHTKPSMFQKWLRFRSKRSGRLWAFYAVVMSLMFAFHISWTFPNGLKINLSPEEYFNFKPPLNNAFLVTHLATVLPAGFLAVLQFVPRVRHRYIGWHRTVGTIVNILTIVSTLSACGIGHVAYGGDLSIHLGVYVLGIMTLGSMFASWMAIRAQRIDEHGRWIIRSWSYQVSIVTLRVIAISSFIVLGSKGGYFVAMSCTEVENSLNDSVVFARDYPECSPDWPGRPIKQVAVESGLGTGLGEAAAIRAAFGMSLWVALWIHAVGVEYYLYKTRDESDRLREVSRKRQAIHSKLSDINTDGR